MFEVATAGFILGVLSSFHCVGMCGPLALSLPVSHLSRSRKTASVLLYHVGRLITYTGLGVLFGFAGRRFYLAGIQQWMSIIAGLIILFFLVTYFVNKSARHPKWMTPFYNAVQKAMQGFLRIRSLPAFTFLGMANALLPCGMVYLAIAGALNTSSTLHGAGFMAAFGAGTMPAMYALSFLNLRIDLQVRTKIKKMMPMVMAAMAVVLILRGMNLGIPFISPILDEAGGEAVICH